METKLHVSTGGGPGLARHVWDHAFTFPVPDVGTGNTIAPVVKSGKFLAGFSDYAVGVHTPTVAH